jgi:hypothetical protein
VLPHLAQLVGRYLIKERIDVRFDETSNGIGMLYQELYKRWHRDAMVRFARRSQPSNKFAGPSPAVFVNNPRRPSVNDVRSSGADGWNVSAAGALAAIACHSGERGVFVKRV